MMENSRSFVSIWEIRNSKHEIPGPDPANTDPVLRSGILALTQYECEERMSRQGGPKQSRMTKTQMLQTVDCRFLDFVSVILI